MHQFLPFLLPTDFFNNDSLHPHSSSKNHLRIPRSYLSWHHAYCPSPIPLRFITSPKLVLKDPFNYNRENPEDCIPYQTLVLRLSFMCCSLRVLSSRRSVSSVPPPSQSGRLSVTVCASRLTTIRRRMLGCRWSLSASRPRLVG